MKGVLLYTNLAGRFPDEPASRPLVARSAALGLPLLLRPVKPVTIEQVEGYEMTSTLGNMFDNTTALTRIIMAGILDELPDLKVVCPHLGGALPFIVGRLDLRTQVLRRGPRNLRHAPGDCRRRIWLDIVSPLTPAMRLVYELLGPDRLLLASDHAWVEPQLMRDAFAAVEMPADDRERIASLNAKSLFQP